MTNFMTAIVAGRGLLEICFDESTSSKFTSHRLLSISRLHSMTSATFSQGYALFPHVHRRKPIIYGAFGQTVSPLALLKEVTLQISSCRMTTRLETYIKSFQKKPSSVRSTEDMIITVTLWFRQSDLNRPHHPLSCYDSMLVCLYPYICHFQLFCSPQHPWLHFPTQFRS